MSQVIPAIAGAGCRPGRIALGPGRLGCHADPAGSGQMWGALILLAIVIIAAEINALVGPAAPPSGGKKMLATLKGTFWAGFILTVILYVVLVFLFGK